MANRLAFLTGLLSPKMWRKGLKAYYTVPLNVPFKQFRNGSIYFGVGFIIIYLANQMSPPSATQELILLGGMLLAGVGFIMAMLAQIRMIIGRFMIFLYKDKNTK